MSSRTRSISRVPRNVDASSARVHGGKQWRKKTNSLSAVLLQAPEETCSSARGLSEKDRLTDAQELWPCAIWRARREGSGCAGGRGGGHDPRKLQRRGGQVDVLFRRRRLTKLERTPPGPKLLKGGREVEGRERSNTFSFPKRVTASFCVWVCIVFNLRIGSARRNE